MNYQEAEMTARAWKTHLARQAAVLDSDANGPPPSSKLYIAVLDEFPDYMTPTLVAHSVLGAHLAFEHNTKYQSWLRWSFKKVTVRVNAKEFAKIKNLGDKHKVYLGHENNTLDGQPSCAVTLSTFYDELPKVLRFAKLWKPNGDLPTPANMS